MTKKVQIFIDGGFFEKKLHVCIVEALLESVQNELERIHVGETIEITGILYFDAPPFEKILTHPITKEKITNNSIIKKNKRFFEKLEKTVFKGNKIEVILGSVKVQNWLFSSSQENVDKYRAILEEYKNTGRGTIEDFLGKEPVKKKLKEIITPNYRQKSVDVKIATKILQVGYEKDTDILVIITNDSDFCEPITVVKDMLSVFLCSLGDKKSEAMQNFQEIKIDMDSITPYSIKEGEEFSEFYNCQFVVANVTYQHIYHYIFVQRAAFFKDTETVSKAKEQWNNDYLPNKKYQFKLSQGGSYHEENERYEKDNLNQDLEFAYNLLFVQKKDLKEKLVSIEKTILVLDGIYAEKITETLNKLKEQYKKELSN